MTRQGEKIEILIVSGENHIAVDLEKRLGNLGCIVCAKALPGEQAFALVERHKPDLVIMDIDPQGGADEIESSKRIWNKWNIPVALLTAYDDIDRVEQEIITYPFGCILKPVLDKQLHININMALNAAKMEIDRNNAEQELKEVTERHQAILSALSDVLFVFNDENRFLDCRTNNPEELLIRPEEFIGKHVDEVLPKVSAELTKQHIELTLASKIPQNYHFHLKVRGEERKYETRMVVSGEHNVMAVVRDVTDRMKAETALRESEKKYRELFHYAPAGIYEIDFVQNRITSVNDVACYHTGYNRDELLRMNPLDLLSDESRVRFAERLGNISKGAQITDQVEYEIVAKSGVKIWALMAVSFVYKNKKIVGASVVSHDITDRKLAEKMLKESLAKIKEYQNDLELYSKLTPLGLITFDNDFNIISWNPGAERIFGFTAEEAVGKNSLDILVPEYEHESVRKIHLITDPQVTTNINDNTTRDGRIITVQWFNSPRLDADGNLLGLMAACQDITEMFQMERALQKSEALLRQIVDLVPHFIFVKDIKGRLILANQAVAQAYGTTVEDLMRRDMSNPSLVEDDILLLRFDDLEIIETGQSKHIPEEIFIDAYGAIRFLQTTKIPFSVSGSEDPAVLCIAIDLTEHKRAAEALKSSEARMRSIFRAAPVGIGLVSNRLFLDVNDRLCEIVGYSKDELIGKNARMLYLTDDDYEYVGQEKYRQIGEMGTGTVETRFKCKDGTIINVLMSSTPVDPSDLSVGVTFTALDITERIQAEEALRESENRFKVLSEESPLGMSLIDQHGCYIYINPAFINMFGYTLEDFKTGREWFNLAFPDDEYRKMVIKDWKEDLAGSRADESRSRIFDARCKDGDIKTIMFRPVTTISLGQFVLYEDITDSKRAEAEKEKLHAQLQQARKMEAVGTLAGGISHDFNNLLQAINGYTQLLLMEKSEKDPEYHNLEAIRNAGGRAADLVRQLLLFSRKADIERKPVELNVEVEQARKILERTIPKMIDIEVHSGSRIWPVLADPVQVEQIFLNLGINAADAMPDGGKLVIETTNITLDNDYTQSHLGAHPGRYVLITFSDTGHGMDRETIEKVFEPFYTTKEIGKGTGLGLASVYGIVKNHDGYIMCYSEVGQGTTFKIYLPALEHLPTEEEKSVTAAPPQGGSETILIVDDEESIRGFAKQALMQFGYTVQTAASGEEALEVYTGKPGSIDLVIMDIGMPGMGGHNCLLEMRQINPTAKVLIASGYSINDQAKKSRDAGAAGFVGKPYHLRELLGKVRSVLDGEAEE